ncbi:MAG: hypothetical protein JNL50_03895 [Phycisphaerae bacterium]|nr:hypothetical protein [Phycisphaerae bacterium]
MSHDRRTFSRTSDPFPDHTDAPASHAALLSARAGTAGTVLAACACVATARYLGFEWLTQTSLGLPMGVWVVALAGAWNGAVRASRARRLAAARNTDHRGWNWPDSPLFSGLLKFGARVAERASALLGFDAGAVAAWHDSIAWPQRPLRVGLAIDGEPANLITRGPGASGIEFVRRDAGDDDESLDAMVIPAEGGVRVRTRASGAHEAAWYDWGAERPLSYLSLFPVRIDPELVTIADPRGVPMGSSAMMSGIVRAAALFARSASRLSLHDRLMGRRPIGPSHGRGQLESLDACMERLAEQTQTHTNPSELSPADRVACRAVSAWLATTGPIDQARRLSLMESVAKLIADEPETMLRLGAVRIASMDDEGGIEAIVASDRLLRQRQTHVSPEQASMLSCELEHGPYSPMTLGRVAAGICLLCASSPTERLAYLRDDLLEDMRYSGWLVGRDTERAVLIDVFRAIERARRGESARVTGPSNAKAA